MDITHLRTLYPENDRPYISAKGSLGFDVYGFKYKFTLTSKSEAVNILMQADEEGFARAVKEIESQIQDSVGGKL